MSTLRQSLRQVLARTLRRGASWLDRLAVRVTPPIPVVSDADDSPLGGPPAHWRQRAHRPPPAHWLARIRQQAPHLLDGAALAGAGWTRTSVSPPAIPLVGVTPMVDEVAPRPMADERPPPAATGQPIVSRPPRRATPLFAGRALNLRRADSPPWTGHGASSPAALPEPSPRSSTPAGSPAPALPASPAVHLAGMPNIRVEEPGYESANRRAAPTAAVAQGAAGTNLPESPNLHSTPPAEPPGSRSSRAGLRGFSPAPAAGDLANSTLDSPAAHGDGAAPAHATGSSPARFTPESPNWSSAAPPPSRGTARTARIPDRDAPGFEAAGMAHESSGWARAAWWPEWNPARPTGALGPGTSGLPGASASDQATGGTDHRAALPWPALPDWPDTTEPEPNPHEAIRQHLQRLDREQRGLLWNESPF
jgi:hypothetical protein